MGKESSLWTWLKKVPRKNEKFTIDMNRIENSACPGMPDVEGFMHWPDYPDAHNQFWLELKHVRKPVRKTTLIKLRNLRPQQTRWLTKRWDMGGCCYLLMQVGSGHDREIYMIAPPDLAELEKGVTLEWLDIHSVCNSKPSQHHIIFTASCTTTRRAYDKYKNLFLTD